MLEHIYPNLLSCIFFFSCSYAKLFAALVLGQCLSALLCGTGVSSQLLFTRYKVEVPTTQAFLNYLLLGFLYGVPVAMRKDFCSILRKNWWKYIFLGLVDVEANYLIILAYKYTNLTTIQVKGRPSTQSCLLFSLSLLFFPPGMCECVLCY